MRAHTRLLSPAFGNAFAEAIVIQLLVVVFTSILLGGATIAQVCMFALLAYWVGAILIVCRRPRSPTETDIQLIRFGYLPLCGIAFIMSTFIWLIRGVLE